MKLCLLSPLLAVMYGQVVACEGGHSGVPSCTNPEYDARVFKSASTFHKNFDKGEGGKMENGKMVSDSIEWDNNNQITLGRQNFVDGLLSFDVPFPNIQIADVIVISRGTRPLYSTISGRAERPFQKLPPSGNNVEFINAEFMAFDQDALLDYLISINPIDQIILETKGEKKIDKFKHATLRQNPQTSLSYRRKIKESAAQFTKNFNNGNNDATVKLASPDVLIHRSDDTTVTGRSALLEVLDRYKTALPNLIQHDEFNVGDGHYVAVEFVSEGTRTGPFIATNGTQVPPDGRVYKTRSGRFLRFDDEGVVVEFWEVIDNDNFLTATA